MRMERWIGSELKGARYCSLGARIAEQFPVETPDGRSLILYQTREDARFEESMSCRPPNPLATISTRSRPKSP
jgi:hypothetical protein